MMLTNNPEITFFKTIYRRYTNFGKIFVEEKFDNNINFGQTSILNIPKAYDLLSNLILKIKLPKIDLNFINEKIKKCNDEKLKILNKYYTIFLNFKLQLQNIVNNFFNNLVSENSNYIEELNNLIRNNITERQYNVFFEIVDYFFNTINIENNNNINYYKNATLYQNKNNILMYIYSNLTVQEFSLNIFENLINENMNILDELNKILYDIILENLNNNSKIYLEWIDKIAIYMFDYLSIYIGSNQIVKLYPDYIDTYGDLTYRNKEVYNNMINHKKNKMMEFYLNKVDSEDYVYLPVPFWFCQTYGLAFPLISLQFNNLQFKIKLKNYFDLLKINYTKDLDKQYVENIINIYKEEILIYIEENLKEQLNITVLLEYISLDSLERRKFAQAGHEYLITQNQIVQFNDATPLNNKFNINFFHCIKELWWFVSKKKEYNDIVIENNNEMNYYEKLTSKYFSKNENYVNYLQSLFNPFYLFDFFEFINGLNTYKNKLINNEITNEIFYDDISTLLNYEILKIPYCQSSSLTFDSETYIDQSYEYFNYLQPYKAYNSTPKLGTNVFSFSLFPTDFQPSGSVNFGRIPSINLTLELLKLNDKPIKNNNEIEDYIVKIYGTNYNVLRIFGGIGNVAFQY